MRKERSDKCWEIGVDSEMMMPVLQSERFGYKLCGAFRGPHENSSHAR